MIYSYAYIADGRRILFKENYVLWEKPYIQHVIKEYNLYSLSLVNTIIYELSVLLTGYDISLVCEGSIGRAQTQSSLCRHTNHFLSDIFQTPT